MRNNKKRQQRFLVSVLLCSILASVLFVGQAYARSAEKIKESKFPVLMYHHLIQIGDAGGVVVTAAKFKKDMEYLRDSGYTPLLPIDLLEIKNKKKKLPKKPIMITFDDGYESNYKLAYPILKETNMKATIFVIANSMDRKVPWQVAKLNWNQMKEMYESGIVDIQSHTYNLHNADYQGKHLNLGANGIQRGMIECKAQYEYRLGEDAQASIETIEKYVGNSVFCLAYPYGAYDPWCTKVLAEKGIQFGFMVEDQIADLKGNLYELKRYNIGMNSDLEEILEGKIETEIY